jgi:TonB family protein
MGIETSQKWATLIGKIQRSIDFPVNSRQTRSKRAFLRVCAGFGTKFMFPQPMSKSRFRSDDTQNEPLRILEQHRRAGFPPDLALDLVLNEIVVRAAEETHATAAALALLRNDEMVCRAATGHPAPDLGFPINLRDGLSAACLKTHEPQLCTDTELDPRVEAAVSRYLGIRSILIVPVFDTRNGMFTGILEVFSSSPGAFSNSDQKLLEGFAEECAVIRQAATESSQSKPDPRLAKPELVKPELVKPELVKPELVKPELAEPELVKPEFVAPEVVGPQSVAPILVAAEPVRPEPDPPRRVSPEPVVPELMPPLLLTELSAPELPAEIPPQVGRTSYEGWTLFLGMLAILAIISVSFLMGSRIGWLRFATPQTVVRQIAPPEPAEPNPAAPELAPPANHSPSAKASEKAPRQAPSRPTTDTPAAAGELVVYEKGKVIFRMKSSPTAADAVKGSGTQLDSSNENDTESGNGNSVADASVSAGKNGATKPGATKVGATAGTAASVWISPDKADALLLSRTEPSYPAKARATRRSGNVVLEVQVAEDGSVSKVRTLSGDPILAAAATEAVRNWRYQPYRQNDHPAQFQTDVTLSFALPN